MKTTVILRDDVFRRAKAQAALRGRSMSRFVEECLEKALEEGEPEAGSFRDWAASLPGVSREALGELREALEAEGFREVEPEMWR